MQLCQFAAKRAGALSHLSLGQAFDAQGVSLKYPARSRSGIRWDDGAVVIAIDEADVRSSADGFRCRLWAPAVGADAAGVDRPSTEERLEHCRLAARHGGADGLLVKFGALVEANVILTLHVARRGAEYWASWGTIARGHLGLVPRLPADQTAYAAAA
jgi:hypothetical protein